MKNLIALFASTVIVSGFLITGCSSSDSDSDSGADSTIPTVNTNPAAIDASNTQAIGVSSGEGVRVATAELPSAITIDASLSSDTSYINDAIKSVTDSILSTPSLATGIDVSPDYCTSGTADVTFEPQNATSGPVTITIIFGNCVLLYGEGEKVDGTSIVYYADISDPFNTPFSITYSNFTFTDADGKATTIPNYTYECDNTTSCTITAYFVGSDGVTSQITNLDTPNGIIPPINGTATFYHGTQGKVAIIFSGLNWGACGAIPVAGSITFTSEDGSEGNIAFSLDCTQTGTWANSSGNGSY